MIQGLQIFEIFCKIKETENRKIQKYKKKLKNFHI